ncbi:chemotaxis protein CheC [Halobacillus andaensis]|uniref:chemotaxis protein CheC n=1 Tax=Halobacillus andaensis TaxID=1176239 RepID=UPI00166F2A8B|nr:chemotaxis protein CheC [Halobacillus andaensis]
MDFNGELSHIQLDALKEIGNIGAGHAASSLSALLTKKIDMTVPSVQVLEFNEVMKLAGGAETEAVGIGVRIEGDVPGSMFFILPPHQANTFVVQLLGSNDNRCSSELRESALQELGNIITGSYLSSLADFTRLNLAPSVPVVVRDMVGAIVSAGLIERSQYRDDAIVIETLLEARGCHHEQVKGHFFLFPDPDFHEKLFPSLGLHHDK